MTSKTESLSTLSSADSEQTDTMTDTTVTTYKTMGQSYAQKKLDQYVSTPTQAFSKMVQLQNYFNKNTVMQPPHNYNGIMLPQDYSSREQKIQIQQKVEPKSVPLEFVHVKENPVPQISQIPQVVAQPLENAKQGINVSEIQRYKTLLTKLTERYQRQEIDQQVYNQLYNDVKQFYLEAIERAIM